MMIGIVVVTHGNIGSEMVRAAQSIVKGSPPMLGVSLEHNETVEAMREKIRRAMVEVDRGEGVMLLSDMFGGTPSNLCISFMEEGKTEVITGVNLPMLIKLSSLDPQGFKSLAETAAFIKTYGQKNIALAGEVLKGSA